MQEIIKFVNENWSSIATMLLIVEQILASTSLKSNSSFQLVCNIIDSIVKRTTKTEDDKE